MLAGTAMEMSVSTTTFPLAGTVVSRDAYRSYPAAKALPLVGARAVSESSLTWRGGGGGSRLIEGSETLAADISGCGCCLDCGDCGVGVADSSFRIAGNHTCVSKWGRVVSGAGRLAGNREIGSWFDVLDALWRWGSWQRGRFTFGGRSV